MLKDFLSEIQYIWDVMKPKEFNLITCDFSLKNIHENIEEGTIDIRAELVSSNKLKLVYTDNGKGIPPEIRKRIFDPFVTTKRGQGGTGLGMHIVYNLVTQSLGGEIQYDSTCQSGAKFDIIFNNNLANTP